MERKITQERLSEMADLNIRTLQRFEAGELNPLVTTVMDLQSALGCTWDSLMGRSKRGPSGQNGPII